MKFIEFANSNLASSLAVSVLLHLWTLGLLLLPPATSGGLLPPDKLPKPLEVRFKKTAHALQLPTPPTLIAPNNISKQPDPKKEVAAATNHRFTGPQLPYYPSIMLDVQPEPITPLMLDHLIPLTLGDASKVTIELNISPEGKVDWVGAQNSSQPYNVIAALQNILKNTRFTPGKRHGSAVGATISLEFGFEAIPEPIDANTLLSPEKGKPPLAPLNKTAPAP